ncbi:MAG TPA: G1 family glutamic endopeptidase, partial [Solirubrobacteraceae bacterium]|nr:G1 family glutamic endopeptidase [Solirubrobacteraceae bacterium]
MARARVRSALVLAVAAAGALALPAAAGANTITSENWAGYAAHRGGVHFRRVSATWVQPAAKCAAGSGTYSAFWVGIGGYSLSSEALEQIGSELDCNADGSETMSAWYELVPSPTRAIHLTIDAGDVMSASVTVSGHRVTLALDDHTRGESFARAVTDAHVDTSSAEWVAEDPSDCSSSESCQTLSLTDFGAVAFEHASAQTAGGKTEPITSSLWTTTEMLLGYSADDGRFVADGETASATPSALAGGGRAFLVTYSGPTVSSGSSGSGSTGSGSTGVGATGPGGGGPGGLGGPGAGGGPPGLGAGG